MKRHLRRTTGTRLGLIIRIVWAERHFKLRRIGKSLRLYLGHVHLVITRARIRRVMTQGRNTTIGTCSACRKREVVTEIKLYDGRIVQFCLPVLKEAIKRHNKSIPKTS